MSTYKYENVLVMRRFSSGTGKRKRDAHIISVQSNLPFPFRQIFQYKACTISRMAHRGGSREPENGDASFFAIFGVCKKLFLTIWRSITHLWLEPGLRRQYLEAFAPRDLMWTSALIQLEVTAQTQVNLILTFIFKLHKGSYWTS